MNSTTHSVHLAFDIHEVLAEANANPISGPLFQAYGMVLQVPVEGMKQSVRHYVYPFVKELFQLLAATPSLDFSFFTSSAEEFAKPFVKELLTRSLGDAAYAKIAHQVHVLAKEQLREGEAYSHISKNRHFQFGNYKKDLDDVFPSPGIPPYQRLLIEDDRSFSAPNQEKNLFYISGMEWTKNLHRYQDSGHILYFCSSLNEFEKIQVKIKSGSAFACYPRTNPHDNQTQFPYALAYYDGKEMQELILSLEESVYFKDLYHKSIQEQSTFFSTSSCYNTPIECAIVRLIRETGLDRCSEKHKRIYIFGPGADPKFCVKRASKSDIAIHLKADDAVIYFTHDPENGISLQNHDASELVSLVQEYWKTYCADRNYFFRETNKKSSGALLYDLLWDKVKDLAWKDKLQRRANHILLLTGALFAAWEESQLTQKPLAKILFNWQCSKEKDGKQFDPRTLRKRTDLYIKGLNLLKTINPCLEPITIRSLESALAKYPKLPEDGAKELHNECIVS